MRNIPTFYPSSETDLRSDYERSLEEQIALRRRVVQRELEESGQVARTDIASAMRRTANLR